MEVSGSGQKDVLSNLPNGPMIDIEFQDLMYSIPEGKGGEKLILKAISGQFKSGQLTAILGASGAGKSTLLNTLAGFKSHGRIKGAILINGQPRNMKPFRKVSRYILQEDLVQPMLTIEEAMMMAANLKMDKTVAMSNKITIINEILDKLRLTPAKTTLTINTSGGERRRLSIALELINNPPVLFLDEPTTGLDDNACTQCISLLKLIAQEGRTVVCSIHTPSSKIFSMFDNVYVMSLGQCTYQGFGPDSVRYLANIGLECPKHFNPADFIIEVCCGEYGNFQDRLVNAIENGKQNFSAKLEQGKKKEAEVYRTTKLPEKSFDRINWFTQFWILITRMWVQMYRDKSHLLLQLVLYIALALLIGISYLGIGQDASRVLMNSRFLFACIVVFLYIPIMPVLLHYPQKIKILRKEHFNKWYRLSAYFCALSFYTIPMQLVLGVTFISMVYYLSDQPMEIDRFLMFTLVCLMTGFTSESFGQLISAQLTLVNGLFIGPVILAPLLILSVYGLGSGYETIPYLTKIAMQFSFIRYSVLGTEYALFQGREKLECPEREEFCLYTDLEHFAAEMGIPENNFVVDIMVLVMMSALFRGGSFYLLKQRMTPNKTFMALHSVGTFIKSHLNTKI